MKILKALVLLSLGMTLGTVHAESPRLIKAEDTPKGTVEIRPGTVGGSYLHETDLKQEGSYSQDIKNPRFQKDQKDVKESTTKSAKALE